MPHYACGSLLVSRNHVLRADRTDPKTDLVWQLQGHESTSPTKPSENPTNTQFIFARGRVDRC